MCCEQQLPHIQTWTKYRILLSASSHLLTDYSLVHEVCRVHFYASSHSTRKKTTQTWSGGCCCCCQFDKNHIHPFKWHTFFSSTTTLSTSWVWRLLSVGTCDLSMHSRCLLVNPELRGTVWTVLLSLGADLSWIWLNGINSQKACAWIWWVPCRQKGRDEGPRGSSRAGCQPDWDQSKVT